MKYLNYYETEEEFHINGGGVDYPTVNYIQNDNSVRCISSTIDPYKGRNCAIYTQYGLYDNKLAFYEIVTASEATQFVSAITINGTEVFNRENNFLLYDKELTPYEPDYTTTNWMNGTYIDLSKINNNDDKYVCVIDFDRPTMLRLTGSTYQDFELDLSHLDASQITSLAAMCQGGTGLLSIKFGKDFNTSNCKEFWSMFFNCKKLTKIDISMFDMSKCDDTNDYYNNMGMFNKCSSLVDIKFNVAKIYSLQSTFEGCSALTSLDLTTWDLSVATNTTYCFKNCTNLTEIKFGGIPPKVFYVSAFTGMPTTGKLYIPSQYKTEWIDVLQNHLTGWERIEY